jgi:Salmonella virulence plasmid 65kDa B protein
VAGPCHGDTPNKISASGSGPTAGVQPDAEVKCQAEGASFNPNEIKGIQAADPGAGVNLIAPPSPNNQGDNRLAFPIELPRGRNGLQPQLTVGYDSAGGNGWLGLGWDLGLPAVIIDTRWGVPRYSASQETETYSLNGDQLTPVAHRTAPQHRTAEKVFHTRVEGQFQRIVRHGAGPTGYTWEVTDKAGTHWLYGGGSASDPATLADGDGNVFLWALREVRDAHGNTMRYRYTKQDDFGVAAAAEPGRNEPGRNLYPQKIAYTGENGAEGRYAVTFFRDRELLGFLPATAVAGESMLTALLGHRGVSAGWSSSRCRSPRDGRHVVC